MADVNATARSLHLGYHRGFTLGLWVFRFPIKLVVIPEPNTFIAPLDFTIRKRTTKILKKEEE